MQFTKIFFGLAALFGLCTANTIEFVNQDSIPKTVIFTASLGMSMIEKITLPAYGTQTVSFPHGWIGNWFTVNQGAAVVPGMLGEIAWDGFAGNHYFDVSAIVSPNDVNGVKMLYPKTSKTPLSGCQTFPCANAYNQPNDIQTLSTTESDLVCLVGNKGAQAARRHARHFVLGAPSA